MRTFLGKEQVEETTATPAYRRSIGFVAQEVEALIQENGYTSVGIESPQNEHDHYGIRYAEFVVPLVKAVQELSAKDDSQQTLIETLQQQNETLKQRIEALEDAMTGTPKEISGNSTQTKSAAVNTQHFALYQNVPNPFDKTTLITALVPEQVQQAKIIIYNLQGLELESYDINQRGSVNVEISGGRFPSGMYLYALLADGRVIDTKKMILTK